MPQSGSIESPKNDYFNDLSQQPPADANSGGDGARRNSDEAAIGTNELQPKAKRIACVLCRKRKLRCDGARPTCGTCKRLSHDCAYDEVRKKSGPKRGYVKLLEARLQQVETLLKGQDVPEQQPKSASDGATHSFPSSSIPPVTMGLGSEPSIPSMNDLGMPSASTSMGGINSDLTADSFSFADTAMATDAQEGFPWEMIGLGLEEPLPPQDTINDLNRIFFEKVHPSAPLIHRPRYLSACNLSPQMRPPICLRYAMWTCAASITDKYDSLADHFYQRARKYLQADEMKGHGETIISIQHCQTWIFIALYEFKNMYFPRAWQSTGRGVRMAQMLGLQRIDGTGLDVKQCLPPPKDWIEREERRRTFWLAFCEDRYASVGTGWPMTIDERDIMTNLPASDQAYDKGNPEVTMSLEQALKPSGASKLSSISGVIVMSCMFGRNLLHLHRPSPDDNDDDLNGEFWRRHRRIESILSHTALSLPDHLRLPAGLPDPNVVFMNMAIHTSAICLHQAAIFKADKHKLPPNVGSESRVRCVTAAAEIARIMRMLSHLDLSTMNPFLAFCLYVAARVFVQYLKFRPKDEQMISSLQFLLAAMNALKRKNPLTESFLVQLDVDLEGMGIDVGQRPIDQARMAMCEVPQNTDSLKCSPLFEIRDSQAAGAEMNNFSTAGRIQNNAPRHNSGTETPGPPFHLARANLNLDVDTTAFNYLGGADSPQYNLPNRNRPQTRFSGNGRLVTLADSLSPPSDADRSPNMNNDHHSTRSNSYKDSSSHTSFTPPSFDDSTNPHQPRHNSTNQPSPSTLGSASTLPTPSISNNLNTNANNLFNMDSNFSNFQPNFLGQQVEPMGIFPGTMQSGWEMSGIEITTGSGMTPMPWSEMLDGIEQGDWSGELGTGAGTGFDGAAGRRTS